jgi:hypothetical protein
VLGVIAAGSSNVEDIVGGYILAYEKHNQRNRIDLQSVPKIFIHIRLIFRIIMCIHLFFGTLCMLWE